MPGVEDVFDGLREVGQCCLGYVLIDFRRIVFDFRLGKWRGSWFVETAAESLDALVKNVGLLKLSTFVY
jgi:hypothetical protein